MMRPLVKLWRSGGVRSFVYIDDGVMASNNPHEAGIISNKIKSDLQHAGFLINHSKSNWVPTKHLSWSGFEFDSSSMTLKVNERKVEKFLDQCRWILQASSVSPRQVAVAVGQLLAMQRALGSQARLRTRYLHFWIDDVSKQHIFTCLLVRLRKWV